MFPPTYVNRLFGFGQLLVDKVLEFDDVFLTIIINFKCDAFYFQ